MKRQGSIRQTDIARRRGVSPANVWPRLLSREDAAAYLGVSASTLDKAVAEGLVAPPGRMFGRVLFDIRKLDEFADRLAPPIDEPGANPFDLVPL